MKEMGGFIELEHFTGEEYHPDGIPLNTGRNCLRYLIRAKGIREICLPGLNCSSVSDVCREEETAVSYYPADLSLKPVLQGSISAGRCLYLINYYGQLDNEYISDLASHYSSIIVDNTQAFFQQRVPGVDTLYTCRKFFGVADGAYLYTDKILAEGIEPDYSNGRMGFLLGRYECGAGEYYEGFLKNEKQLTGEGIKHMSGLTHNLLRAIDYAAAAQARKSNFECLHEFFSGINRLELNAPDGAFMYPLYIENGAAVRQRLLQKKIYIPILWPDVLNLCARTSLEYDMAANILPLPVDQRYGREEMRYLAKEVRRCIG